MMRTTGHLSVFIVDDDKLFTTSLSFELKEMFREKLTIQVFSTGEECLKHYQPPPDIIILDYFLNSRYPDAMNGLQVLMRIMLVNPEAKVIMLSGQDKIEIAVDAIKNGAYDYIVKNDNVFLRLKFAILNASEAIAASKNMKNYKLWTRIVIAILLLMCTCAALQYKFPSLFR
jgi:two-component system OmpR family response regulator